MHPTVPPTRRRAALAVLAVAVLMLVAVPASASARTTCDAGEFCLYSNKNLAGGLYEFSGSDSELSNDEFANEDTLLTGNNSESAQNRGIAHPSGLNDVAVYTDPGFEGDRACIRRGAGGNLNGDFTRDIESYKWVTRAACNKMPSALAARSPAG
jgi:hypothetical protein